MRAISRFGKPFFLRSQLVIGIGFLHLLILLSLNRSGILALRLLERGLWTLNGSGKPLS